MSLLSQPEMPGRNLLLRLAYDGTDFFGWQIQPRRPTIQGVVAEAVANLTGEAVSLHGAGRTDAGVHAFEQAANFRTASPIPCSNLLVALNDRLPESIRILSIEEVSRDFHARHHAIRKSYRYRIFRRAICPPHLCRYVYPYAVPLDTPAMEAAAKLLEGTHNFRSFASSDPSDANPEKSFVRVIYSSTVEQCGDELVYTVTGSGFLNHMVRNIVGTLVLAGRGRISSESISSILAAKDRSAAGPTVPARGLHLVSVEYPPGVLAVAINV